ncbi:MAG: sigma-70 family RNA polymerase sigma factor [Myxococcales bacterium]|nr:sigma-70 family RNA polymerase sigma factor [Myxococcota bacterium]MDW8281025.1 sigma-70 family RNA polymerase sigma factor [Myxococcales bacterium]
MRAPHPDLRRAGDHELLAAVMQRDRHAWAELMRRYRPLMFRCILRVLRRHGVFLSTDDMDEIFGDVCVSILHNDMHKLRAWNPVRGTRLGSWLGLLATHVTHDHLRQRARQPPLLRLEPRPDEPMLTEQPAAEPSALERLIDQERWVELGRLLRGFSSRDRRFVELYYGHGLSPEEVAAAMGISVKTVYSKKNKVHTRLQRLVSKGGQTDLAA